MPNSVWADRYSYMLLDGFLDEHHTVENLRRVSPISVKSELSVNLPITFSEMNCGVKRAKLEAAQAFFSDQLVDQLGTYSWYDSVSPVPSPLSLASNQTMDCPFVFKRRSEEIPSPCVSYRSDQSMYEPMRFKDKREIFLPRYMHDTVSPAPSSISLASNQSMDRPFAFKRRSEEIPSPCVSYRSDQSMYEPMRFKDKREIFLPRYMHDTVSPAPSSISLASNQSMDRPFAFKRRSEEIPSPCVSYRSDQSMYEPMRFKEKKIFLPSNAGPRNRSCDICEQKQAVKLCMTCDVFYCEVHVRQHYTVKALQRHTLLDATEDLKPRNDQLQMLDVKSKQKDILVQQLLKTIGELRAQNQKVESELSFFTKHFYRGIGAANDFTSDLVEVAALGRQLDLGILYDCRSDSFSPDDFLWDNDTVTSVKLSIPQFYSDERILEGDTLHDRLSALELTVPLRASVISGLAEVSGAAAFLKHPNQLQLQERVTLHFRTSTRLDMLSHKLLHDGPPLPQTSSNTATHVVVAVLYGAQAFCVLDRNRIGSKKDTELREEIKKMMTSSGETEQLSSLGDGNLYIDGNVLQSSEKCYTAVNHYRSLKNTRDPQHLKAVPLKAWLLPLKCLDATSAHVVKEMSEDQLLEAEKRLEYLKSDIEICQQISNDKRHEEFKSLLRLNDCFAEGSLLLQQYQSVFQRRLASSIKAIREKGAEIEKNLQDLMKRHDESPFSPLTIKQWLKNQVAEMRALNHCRSANVIIVKSKNELQSIIQNSQTDVMCFALTSVEAEDAFVSRLRQHLDLVNTTNTEHEAQQPFRLPDTSQKIISDLQRFLFYKESYYNAQQTMFLAASVPDPQCSGSSIHLYQSGSLVSCNVKLDIKPEPAEIIAVQQTRATVKLPNIETHSTKQYRVEYKADKHLKWRATDCFEENCVISDLVPEFNYQLRYAVIDNDSMSDYSRITEFYTPAKARPGAPTILKQNEESYLIAWQRPETDEDSPVICYEVEYMEPGLKGWQSIQTDGPECECTISLPSSTCYKARISAVYGDKDISSPSEETKAPVRVWSIDLSKRKASIFLDVLKVQARPKSIKIRDCVDDENEVKCFLQALPYISHLRFDPPHNLTDSHKEWRQRVRSFLLNLCLQAALHQKERILDTLKLPLCYLKTNEELSGFLLDLYSHAEDYEAQKGRNLLPALGPVFQSLPAVWSINFSEPRASSFLKVLKLQRKKKPVELKGWTDEESEIRILLQCLPYISQLRFIPQQNVREYGQKNQKSVRPVLFNLCLQAALYQNEMIETAVETAVLPCLKTDKGKSAFLLNLYSSLKEYETKTSESVLKFLPKFYQLFPSVWCINLSETRASDLLELLKLQTQKKPLKLSRLTDEESEIRSLLQCLPYISELRVDLLLHGRRKKLTIVEFLVKLIVAAAAECDTPTGQSFSKILASVCSFTTFSFMANDKQYDNTDQCMIMLDLYSSVNKYEIDTGKNVLPALLEIFQSVMEVWTTDLLEKKALLFLEVLKLQTVKKHLDLTGWSNAKRKVRSFLQCLPFISHLRLYSDALLKMAKANRLRAPASVSIEELTLVLSSTQKREETFFKVLSNLSFLLRLWNVKCLNLTEFEIDAELLTDLVANRSLPKIRLSEETLQQLAAVVYKAQDEELACRFLQKVGGDLTSCSLNWEVVNYFSKCHMITVDFRKINISQKNIQDLLPVLDKVQFRRLKSSFLLPIIKEIYETGSSQSVSSLLNSLENCIKLNSRDLDSVHCAALRYVLQHCTAISLSLQWTSIPEEELKSIVPLLKHVSHLSVDRLLLLRLLHCCSVSEVHQETEFLFSALQHQLDFSSSTLDLTEDTEETSALFLSKEDCRVITTTIQRAKTQTLLILQDCEIEKTGVEQLFSIFHKVKLRCSNALTLQFLDLVHAGPEEQNVRRAVILSKVLGDEVDLSQTHLKLQSCRSLALVLDQTEGLSELDLSHCQLTDDGLEQLLPYLHKTSVLDLSYNDITDVSARKIYERVSGNNNVKSVCLFNNRITDTSLFFSDLRFEIW
ncbi:uncharacterized protein si:ch211-281l24.3 [Trichomycterus rosablanca]|uniref:uncharacterized protein si:ch211-281l24.3 n=1 Tax=Trichomycterus rosablanca TaxID=2290929 RepID=UPI002F36073B